MAFDNFPSPHFPARFSPLPLTAMRRAATGPVTALIVASTVALASPAHAAPGSLPPEVAAALERAKLPRDAIVAVVQEVSGSRPRLAWRTDQPVNPASLMKLTTTFAGLDLLGPAFSWATPVWLQGNVRDGVLEGNLVIKGSGDPKLVLERLWLMLRRVQQLGVREIRGDIVLDRSAFAVPEQNPGDFDGEPLRPYNVRADALQLNYKSVLLTFTPDAARGVAIVAAEPPLAGVRIDATVPLTGTACDDWRGALKADFSDATRIRLPGNFALACGEKLWPVAYADPRSYNERALAGLWAEMGGRLTGSVRDGSAPNSPPSFELASPSLAEIVRDINKFSDNVMAQQLFLTLGLTQRGAGTPEAAREVLEAWLSARLGNAAAGLVIDNGSGLSRATRVSATLLSRLLIAAWASPVMPELMSSLPVAGIDGTMKRSRATLGRSHIKTGSLRDVNGVAGYVLANSGRRYVVVGIVNHPNASAARPALDALVQWAANDGPPMAPGELSKDGITRGELPKTEPAN
ncbi:D-alanyl-D-alanine carboxypeptidase/D-alanyl-D-alanine-endopeptidase [soil metagenome]